MKNKDKKAHGDGIGSFRWALVVFYVSCFWIVILLITRDCVFFSATPPFRYQSHQHSISSAMRLDSQNSIAEAKSSGSETVAVVIRCHTSYAKQLISLLWALDAQSFGESMFILIAPTEYDSVSYLQKFVRDNWSSRSAGNNRLTVTVMDLDASFYERYCCLLKPICTEEWRKGKLARNWSTQALNTYCTTNSPLHYYVTDQALSRVQIECPTCEFLLVTNADNAYAPEFLDKSISTLRKREADVSVANMIHRGQPIEAQVERSGGMDLGGVILRLNIFRRSSLSFASLLPTNPEPQDWHDADFWMVYNLLNRHGKRLVLIKEYLFAHN